MSNSNIVLLFCLLFIGGIFLSSFQTQVFLRLNLKLLIYLIVFFILVLILGKRIKYALILSGCLLFLLGILRYEAAYTKVYHNQLTDFNGLKVAVVGRIVSEPILKSNGMNFVVNPQRIETSKRKLKLVNSGKILIVTRSIANYRYGNIIYLKGKLIIPSVYDNFNYRMFLAKDGIYSIFYYPEIEVVSENSTNNLRSFIFALKNRMREYISNCFSSDQALILRAIILGDKNYLTDDLKNKLNIAGIRHVVAISGTHIVIIESILMTLLLSLGLWRNQALCLTLFFSFIFIALTGFQVSAVRAWIMGSFYILSSLMGRRNNSFRALIFTAVIMLVYNPLILRYDVSFQLSFLAVIGIIYLTPLFNYWLKFIPNKKFFNLRNILSMTLSAQIATFPLLVYYFGHISLIAPLTNILIIPILPLLIFFGLFSSLLGSIRSPLGVVFVIPCLFFLSYIERIINFFSQFPFYFKVDIPLFYIILLYSVLIFFVWKYNRIKKLRFLDYPE